jgi:intein-encoded DNA endonuclease-like protein
LVYKEAAYISGFFDGEGCVHFRKHEDGRPIFIMTQRTSEVMEWIFETLGYGNLYVQQRTDGNSPFMYKLSIRRVADMRRFANAVLPYSIVKREKLELALKWLDDHGK